MALLRVIFTLCALHFRPTILTPTSVLINRFIFMQIVLGFYLYLSGAPLTMTLDIGRTYNSSIEYNMDDFDDFDHDVYAFSI